MSKSVIRFKNAEELKAEGYWTNTLCPDWVDNTKYYKLRKDFVGQEITKVLDAKSDLITFECYGQVHTGYARAWFDTFMVITPESPTVGELRDSTGQLIFGGSAWDSRFWDSPVAWLNSPKPVKCNHTYINVGFHHVKMVCKHCDSEG